MQCLDDVTKLRSLRYVMLRYALRNALMSRIERMYCLISTSCLSVLFDISILRHIWQILVCFGELLLMRTLCDAYHMERASHLRSILDISDGMLAELQKLNLIVTQMLWTFFLSFVQLSVQLIFNFEAGNRNTFHSSPVMSSFQFCFSLFEKASNQYGLFTMITFRNHHELVR